MTQADFATLAGWRNCDVGEVYLYLDETGDFDMSGKAKASPYFGLGQATFTGNYSKEVWDGLKLRFDLEAEGIKLPSGLHAKNDTNATRSRVFALISNHAPRIDTTLLLKKNALPRVRQRIINDDLYLYRLAWFLHFKWQAQYVLSRSDKIYVVAATLGTGKKKAAACAAVEDVCRQFAGLDITLCAWDSSTSWGLQVADYALWTIQRRIIQGFCAHYETIYPLIETCFHPWEGIRKRPTISDRPEKRAPGSLVTDRAIFTVPVQAPPVKNIPSLKANVTPSVDWWGNQADPWAAPEQDPNDYVPDPSRYAPDPWEQYTPDPDQHEPDPWEQHFQRSDSNRDPWS